jgi:hypothetical protein
MKLHFMHFLSVFCYFLLLKPEQGIMLIVMFSQTPCSSVRRSDQVLQPYGTGGKITVLFSLNLYGFLVVYRKVKDSELNGGKHSP